MASLLLTTLALFSFFISFNTAAPPKSAVDEAEVLIAFKRAVLVDPDGLLAAWDLTGGDGGHCSWRGVSCDPQSNRVISLTLSGGYLVGALTPEIGGLSQLRALSLPDNSFSGEIPAFGISNLRRLEVLDLRCNNFSGGVPAELGGLRRLRILDLSRNSLSGDIPATLIGYSKLSYIDLSFNQISGKLIISSNNTCKYLTHLKISHNNLVDIIPPEIGKCTNLETLILSDNILEGRIPRTVGNITRLRILDLSRNSLTNRVPKQLGDCKELSILVLTNLMDLDLDYSYNYNYNGEFNAFLGSIPMEIFSLPTLEILWAPRANLGGRLPVPKNGSCSLRALNMGGNYLSGLIPEWLGTCENLSLLDLSSNYLEGLIPVNLGVHRMIFFNVSRNSLSGPILFDNSARSSVSSSKYIGLLENEKLLIAYSDMLLQNARKGNPYEFVFDDINFVVLHDFSWNEFVGPLPALFNLGGSNGANFSYGLLLNNNKFNGSLTPELFRLCGEVIGLALNLSNNQIQGNLDLISSCSQLKSFGAAYNRLNGPLPSTIGLLQSLLNLDLRGNYLKSIIPDQLGNLKFAEQILLGANNLSGEIPVQLGQMTSLKLLDLSQNCLRGAIPSNLANAAKLELLLLDHNQLSGSIPSNFSMLINLTTLDVSYNNLSGSIPHLVHSSDCEFFRGNRLLQPCLIPASPPPSSIPSEGDFGKGKLKPLITAAVTPAAVLVLILIVLVIFLISRRRKLVQITSLRRKVLVTFTDVPAELSYENVVKATGNFSIQNLIGSGGFGSTYKAELAPGFLVAVKRLAMNRFHGLQQFDAEIRTLGRIRHKNLVTLIGYHMGESDTFLIYNYLSQGNLETFIQKMHGGDGHWPLIHKIAVDVAQALCYLHYSCVPRIVHRDIKPSNILLDEKLNAYLSDFGLARLLEVSETHATTDVAGTFGYVAPEYAMTCRVSDKSDVYSFGVVLLELISGKRSLDPSFSEFGNGFTIVTWGRLLIKEGRSSELFVPSLWVAGPKDKLISMLKLALSCTAESLSVRPSMKKVLERLKQLKS